jgi:hypothetical protein
MRMEKRYNGKRIRKTTKSICLFIAVLLILIPLCDIFGKLYGEDSARIITEQIYSYTTNFKYDYKVNLIENNYIENDDLVNKDMACITDLIDNIDLNLNYDFKGDQQEKLTYEYEIIGETKAVYSKNGTDEIVLDKEETLVEKTINTVDSEEVSIAENIQLDLKNKNELIAEFEQKMGISVTAEYNVIMKVTVKTNVQGEDVNNSYTSDIKIDLAEKVTGISGDNNQSNTEYISKETGKEEVQYITLIFDFVAIAMAILILRYISIAKVTNTIRNEYKYELNKILKLCQDRIVMIDTKPETTEKNITIVSDFGELAKLSEELFKPILCYIDEENGQTWFTVVSDNAKYRYILKK